MREERARKQRMLEIQKCCGVRISESDRTVLEKIVQAEAGNQDHQGKLLVANVILNRVRSGKISVHYTGSGICSKTVFADFGWKLFQSGSIRGYQEGGG